MLLGQLEVHMMQWLFSKAALQRTQIVGSSMVNSCGPTQHTGVLHGVLFPSRNHIQIFGGIVSLIITYQGVCCYYQFEASLNWGLLGLCQV